jgi:hypothetical protein
VDFGDDVETTYPETMFGFLKEESNFLIGEVGGSFQT